MASPFSIFRKNQKVLIALLAVLAMIAFVFLPIIMERMGMRATGPNPIVAKTSKFGSLKLSDVRNLQSQKQNILRVLTDLVVRALPNPETINASAVRQWIESELKFGPATEEVTVNRWLMARYAEQMGMVVTNAAINEFLKELTRNAVTVDGIRSAFRNAGMTDRQFFHVMRDELLANQLYAMFEVSLYPATPGERWDYFNRVKRSANIEAIPITVESCVQQVEDPSDEELKAFFEEHKNQIAFPFSPTPGFRRPHKAAFQYFKADYEQFNSPEKITDAEIQQHYQKNKDSYDRQFKKPEPEAQGDRPEAEKQEPEKSAEQKPAADASKQPVPDAAKEPAETAPAEGASKPSATEPAKPDAAEEKESNATSSAARKPAFVLVSLTEDEKPAEKAAPAPQPAELKKDLETAEKQAEANEKPASETPAPGVPEKNEPQNASKPEQPAETPKAGDAAAPAATTGGGLTDEQKNIIRRDIATEKIFKIFADLRDQMEQYGRLHREYAMKLAQLRGDEQAGDRPQPPTPLDLKKLAEEHGVVAGQSKLMTSWESQGSEIGASLINGRFPVAQYAFSGMPLFRPEMSIGAQGSLFLFWKNEEAKEATPKFEDPGVREEVLKAWKMVRARALAMKQAKTLAEEARKAAKPLKEVFANRPNTQVIAPPPFSWMTFGNLAMGSAQRAVLSQVPEIDMAGQEFMKAVFGLQESGEVAAAFNAPQTVVYVVRLKDFSPAYSVLWDIFEVENFRSYASAGAEELQQTQRAWLEEIRKSAGFEWAKGYKPGAYDEGNAPAEE